jgi:hypothetical protein
MTVDGRNQGERAISVVFLVLTALVLAGEAWFMVRPIATSCRRI